MEQLIDQIKVHLLEVETFHGNPLPCVDTLEGFISLGTLGFITKNHNGGNKLNKIEAG